MVPVTPYFPMPVSCAAAMIPVRYGSSEKYSKLRPFNGFLWILMPGPKSVSILFFRSSMPSISYSSSTSSGSKVQASKVPLGRAYAMVPQSIRIPEGPSEQQAIGIPNFFSPSVTPPKAAAVPGVTFGEHMPSPRVIQIRSSSDSCVRNCSNVIFPSDTSASFQPRSPAYSLFVGLSLRILSARSIVRKGTSSQFAMA